VDRWKEDNRAGESRSGIRVRAERTGSRSKGTDDLGVAGTLGDMMELGTRVVSEINKGFWQKRMKVKNTKNSQNILSRLCTADVRAEISDLRLKVRWLQLIRSCALRGFLYPYFRQGVGRRYRWKSGQRGDDSGK
jgi:hypothetical protein